MKIISFCSQTGPLSTLEYEPSEKSSSPFSGKASTVFATVPSHFSGRTPPQTPCSACERTPIPPIPRMGSAHYSTISTVPSDDFVSIELLSCLSLGYLVQNTHIAQVGHSGMVLYPLTLVQCPSH